MTPLKPKDSYQVQAGDRRVTLSFPEDVFTSLYLPIIGREAFSLWQFFLWQVRHVYLELKTHNQILTWLDFGLPEFLAARQKLEALGLLKSFYQEKEGYLYELYPPLDYEEFFEDAIFTQLLAEKIGMDAVQSLQQHFLISEISTANYQEVTTSFTNIFTKDWQPSYGQLAKKANEKKEETSSFNWLFFQDIVEKQGLHSQFLTKEDRKELQELVALYGYEELTFAKLVLKAFDPFENHFDLKKLKQIIAMEFNEKLQQLTPKSENFQIPQEDRYALLTQQGFSEAEIAFIKAASTMAPLTFLAGIKKQKGGYVGNSERYIVENLHKRHVLPDAVINVLLDYILRQLNRPNLQGAYVDAIANTWAQEKITTPEEAILKTKGFKGNKETISKQKRTSSPKKEVLPAWVDQKLEETEMNPEEAAALKRRIAKLKESR